MRMRTPEAARAVSSAGSSVDAMGNYVSEQLIVFLRSIALGAVLGVVYDLLGALRRLGGRLWGGVLDAVFCLAAAGSVFLFVMAGDGEMRMFIALGVLGGAVLFWCLLGSLLRPVWIFWLDMALWPIAVFQNILKKFGQKLKKVFSFLKKRFTIKVNTLRRKKSSGAKEGDDSMRTPARGRKNSRSKKKKRMVVETKPTSKLTIIILAVLMVGISVQIYQMAGKLRDAKVEELAYVQQLADLEVANAQLKADLENSGSLDLIEDIARDKLGMVKEGEKVFHFSK